MKTLRAVISAMPAILGTTCSYASLVFQGGMEGLADTADFQRSYFAANAVVDSDARATQAAQASASIVMRPGVLGGAAAAEAASVFYDPPGDPPGYYVNTTAQATVNASFYDTITISSPGYQGLAGVALFSAGLNGHSEVGMTDEGGIIQNQRARAGAQIILSVNGEQTSGQMGNAAGFTTPIVSPGQLIWVEAPFVFGQPFSVSLELSVSSLVDSGAGDVGSHSVAGALFGDRGFWGGIDSVRGPEGSSLESWNALGSTSVDYAVSFVPEMAGSTVLTAALLGGVAGFLACARKASRSS